LAIVAISLVMAVSNEFFFAPGNFLNVARAIAIVGIVAAASTPMLISGNVDLSVAATMGISGMTAGALLVQEMPVPVAIAGALVVGLLMGFVNSVIVVRFQVNSLIATIGTAFIARGVAFLVNGGRSIFIPAESYVDLAQGSALGIPKPVYYMVVVFAVIGFVMRYTKVGAHIYAVGSSPEAARRAGISVPRITWGVFLASGFFSALAGVVLTSQAGSAFPYGGQGRELEIIAAVIVGGTALTGGRGTITGTIFGVVLLGIIANSLNLLGLPVPYQDISRGLLLVGAVATDQISGRSLGGRGVFRGLRAGTEET
jgi:ribose transport system permease protein